MFASENTAPQKKVAIFLPLFSLLLFVSTVLAQGSNPPVSSCGLPYEGEIVESVTYTLTSHCDTSGHLVVTNGAEVTIINTGSYRYKIAIDRGKVHHRLDINNSAGPTSDTVTYDNGTIIYNPLQKQVLERFCFQNLGAIGLICRIHTPEPVLEIYGITPDSKGHFLLRVTQTQVDAVAPGSLVASTPDGRVAVRHGQEGHVTISMGPNDEGKVHNVTLKDTLNGSVIGTFDTSSGPPGATVSTTETLITIAPVPAVIYRQPARADGSLVHVVRSGDTTYGIAKAYGVVLDDLIKRNQLVNRGRVIQLGQELVIREAHSTDVQDESTTIGDETTPSTSPPLNCPETRPLSRDGQIIHIVRPGDTVYCIAKTYGVDQDDLIERNQLINRGRLIQLGQELVIREAPSTDVQDESTTIGGETIPSTSSALNCPEAQPLSRDGQIIHVVRPGDTVYCIAKAYSVDLDDLIERNQLINRGRVIFPGQELVIRDERAPTPIATEDDE